MVEPEKYIRAYKIKSNDAIMFIETYKTHKTCINIIMPRINQVFQTMHTIPRKGTIIPVSSKPL